MSFLNYVKTESYVSLIDVMCKVDEHKSQTMAPSFMFGVDKEGVYLRADNCIDGGKMFVERRIDSDATYQEDEGPAQTTLLRLEYAENDSSLLIVTLDTTHYAFSKNKSRTLRNLDSFFFLYKTLKYHHPYAQVPTLPMKPILWLSSSQKILNILSSFLAKILSNPELLSNKAVHLFLQSEVTTNSIQENLEGKREDKITSNSNMNLWQLFKARRRKSFYDHLTFIKK